jgi:hypothetical protein
MLRSMPHGSVSITDTRAIFNKLAERFLPLRIGDEFTELGAGRSESVAALVTLRRE